MYLKAINATLAAWVVGLFADANIRLGDPQGFLCLRGCLSLPVVVLSLLTTGWYAWVLSKP